MGKKKKDEKVNNSPHEEVVGEASAGSDEAASKDSACKAEDLSCEANDSNKEDAKQCDSNKEDAKQNDSKNEKKEPTSEDIIADLNDRLVRNMAEFDNFRKRTDKEKAARFEMGERSVIEKILPIVDNFERGIAVLSDEQKQEAFAKGMIKTYEQMLEFLEGLGVKPIEAVGKEFNPDFHNAVMHIDDEGQPENTIVEELQKGYMMNDTVIRYSMVKVCN